MGTMSNFKYHRATGAGVLGSTLAPGRAIVIVRASIHLGAPSATAENLTGQLDSAIGAAYDLILFAQDMNTLADYVWYPEIPVPIASGDEIDFAWGNTNTETYGLEVVYRWEI